MEWFARRWRQWWFAPARPGRLGFLRLVFFGALLLIWRDLQVSGWAYVPADFWMPMPLLRVFSAPPVPSPAVLDALELVFKAALLLACVGFFTRISVFSALLLGLYLLGLPNNYGKVHHLDTLPLLFMAIFAMSRCGDAWSIDSLRRRLRATPIGGDAELPASGEYGWPIRLMCVLMALIFCGSGLAKVLYGGPAWVFSDNMGILLTRHHVTHEPPTTWGLAIARIGWMTVGMAAATVVLEVGAPLALLHRRLALVIMGGLFGMQIGIWLLMGVPFAGFLLCYAAWVPWDRIGRRVRDDLAPSEPTELLYDGGCGLCRRTIALVRAWDLLGQVRLSDVASQWGDIQRRHPQLDPLECLREMHLIEPGGRVRKGFHTYRALAWKVPIAWPVAPLLYLPGVPAVGERVYGWVAARRLRQGCDLPAAPKRPEA